MVVPAIYSEEPTNLWRLVLTGSLDLTREQFIQRLIDAGWSKEEAEKEYDKIQEEDDCVPD